MDVTKVQTLVDRVKTITGTLSYTSAASTIAEVTFNELTSAADVDVLQAGGYQFKKLASAQTINLRTGFTTTVTNVDLGALTTATTVNSYYCTYSKHIISQLSGCCIYPEETVEHACFSRIDAMSLSTA